jgi:hypothetical protein
MHQTKLKLLFALAVSVLLGMPLNLHADEFDREPINYSTSKPVDRVSQLQQRIDDGTVTLKCDAERGYLRSVLDELRISDKSQMLVFSKTSMQRHCISPSTPRALYFNDDVYIGFCQHGEVLEVSVMDPNLGMVFYTLDQQAGEKPKFFRQTDNCLQCHGGSQTNSIPGNLVRSVYSDLGGFPILSSGSFRIDHTSPLEKRWGGWYVSGEHGPQKHLGNLIVKGKLEPEQIDNSAGHNVINLQSRVGLSSYLTPHSDIVALMVLEHQAMAQNLLTQANFVTRQALHYETALNRELNEPVTEHRASTLSRIRSVGDPLVEYLLFSNEARLVAPIKGTSGFTEEFGRAARRDSEGRSLRDFDVQISLQLPDRFSSIRCPAPRSS